MGIVGHTTTEFRRARLLPTDTPLTAKVAYEKDTGEKILQEYKSDQNGYILFKNLENAPLSTLSNMCHLRLNFTYKHGVITKTAKNTTSWIPNWRSPSPTLEPTDSSPP